MRITLDDTVKQEIKQTLDRGVPVAEVGRRFNVTPTQVKRVLAEPAKSPKLSKAEQVDRKLIEIKALVKYRQGYSHAKLATMAGTSPSYVKKWLTGKQSAA